ncbi:hypothetical protein PUV44_23210 [Xanthomonas arboricola pv. corylina]|nr:hypothetical protein PUV44_23210 [Xanthomonas arboricola pv. corylina]
MDQFYGESTDVLHTRFLGRSNRGLMLGQTPAWHVDRICADQQQSIHAGKSRGKRFGLVEVCCADLNAPGCQIGEFGGVRVVATMDVMLRSSRISTTRRPS